MSRFVWTAHQRDGESPVYTASWPDSHTSTGQEKFEHMAQDATFDSPHVALMCNRLDQRKLLRATSPRCSHTVEDLDASCIEHYRERLRFASRISTTTSGFPREVQGDHLSGICCSPLNLVDSAAKRMGAQIDDCHGVWTFEQTRGESRFDKIGLRTWTNESALCGLLASMLSVASNAFNALPVGAGEASGPSNASSARRHVVWVGEDFTDLPPSPAFAKEISRTRADAKWDFALFSYSIVEGNATDCQDVRIIAVMEVKRYISLETLAGIVALGSGGSKPPEVLGGSKASASARLLAQLVEYCMGTGARTGVIFSGAYLLVVDMDGTNKPRITVRTPSVAPACGPILETPSRSGNDLETRYNLPCTLLALMTHALERAERLGQRPILQKHVLDENSDADYKHVESSGSSQDRPSSRQLRSHTRRVRSRPTPRGSAQGLLDEAKSRPDVELRGLPIGGGACARVYRAYVLSGQIMPTSSGTTLLAKVYWLRGQSYQHYEDTFHPVALHEARIYRALEVLQGESVPHVVGILTRGAGTEQQLQQWCDDSTFAVTSAVTPRAPLPEADIDTPPLRASRGSDKDKASIKLCPTPPRQVLGLVLTDAGKTLAEMSYKDLIQLAQSVEADVEVSVGSMAAALKEAFLRSARSIHAAGVLHCDIRAANMCVAVEQGKLRCRFIDFHLATFADPQKDGKHFGNELQGVEEVVDDSLSNILSA